MICVLSLLIISLISGIFFANLNLETKHVSIKTLNSKLNTQIQKQNNKFEI
jgi:hypothetical protein